MATCDGCDCLEIERPVNRYDVWRALCCDPDKPAWLGARRTVGVAPAGSELGPVKIQRPLWCRIREITTGTQEIHLPDKKKAATVAETP